MKAPAPSTSRSEPLPLPGRQFHRFLLIFHIVFLAGLAMVLVNRWRQPGFSWQGQDWALAAITLAQAGIYLRFFAFPSHWPVTWWAWGSYFLAGISLWYGAWRIEPHFEWVVLAYLGQMFGALPPRLSLPGAGAVFLVYLFTKLGWERLLHLTAPEALSYSSLVVASTALGLFLHRLVITSAERAKLIEDLQAAHRELEAARQRDAELAALRERERLARDLHDSLGHGLVAMTVQLEAAQRLISVDPARAGAILEEMKTLARNSMDQLRRSLAGLRSPGLGERRLSEALSELRIDSGQPALELAIDAPGLDELPPAVSEATWRLAQEGLANVQKHARARHARVEIHRQDHALIVRVSDDGAGAPEDAEQRPGHYGLRGLRERVEGLGGQFCLTRRQPAGTLLEARIPLVAS